MKYMDAEFPLLFSDQWDCSLTTLNEADITPSLNPHIALHFKYATSPTHRDYSYSAMIQFAKGTVSYIALNGIRPTVCSGVIDIIRINVYKKQNVDIL